MPASISARLTTAIVGVLIASSVASAAEMTRHADVITISETIKGSGTSAYPVVTAVQSPVANISGLRRPSTPGGTDLKVATPPWPAFPGETTFDNNAEAEDAIGDFLKEYSSQAANRVCTLLSDKTSIANVGVVDYYQTLTVNGEPARITGSLMVRDNCESNFMGVRVTNKFERVIFAVYRQGALADGLPDGWRLPYPGVLRWKMYRIETARPDAAPVQVRVNGQYEHSDSYLCSDDENTLCPTADEGPLGEWGFYDEPQYVEKNDGSDFIYHCAIDDDGKCSEFEPENQAPTSIGSEDVFTDPYLARNALISEELKPMLEEHNAQYVVLDYGRTVRPEYRDDPDTDRRVPRVSIHVTERKIGATDRAFFITPASGGEFSNEGYYGYKLNYTFNRSITYQGEEGTYDVQMVTRSATSPNETYSKSVSMQDRSHSFFTPRVIDPFDTNSLYEWKDDDVNDLPQSSYESVAPLIVE